MTANQFSRNSASLSLILAILVSSLLIVSGCQNKKASVKDDLPNKQGQKAVLAFEQAQKAQGAKDDATLYARHFDGKVLNSLGREKLDLILLNYPVDRPLAIYLNVCKKHDKKLEKTVLAYLKDKNFPTKHVEIKFGTNPATYTPSQENLARLNKTETTATTDSYNSGTGSSSSAGTSSQGSGMK